MEDIFKISFRIMAVTSGFNRSQYYISINTQHRQAYNWTNILYNIRFIEPFLKKMDI